jgi:hypothetical protein
MSSVVSRVRALAVGRSAWWDVLPWRRFTIYTTSTAEEATAELSRSVGRRPFLSVFGAPPLLPFSGLGKGSRFTLRRQIAYRNSFQPVIEVVILPHPRGAQIEVQMHLHFFVFGFMLIWMSGATAGALAGLALALFHGRPEGLLALLIPLFGGGMTSAAFGYEARCAEGMLRAMFPPASFPLPEGLPPYR